MSAVRGQNGLNGAGGSIGGCRGVGRNYERITREDLGHLAEIARLDRKDLFARKPRYRVLEEGLVCVALCQGAALHFVDGENGVKDFDLWTFYAARPGHPIFPWRRRVSREFGDARFGRPPEKPAFVGRRVDLLGRSIEVGAQTDPTVILRGYLSEGRTGSARALAQKAAVLLEPSERLGTVVWTPER
ncbi:MAG: hypothetical protein M3151_09205 [Actinomycetota bacterium]|nr:hypothetical protein [Actinomycetota bacterium]